jgi:hypothetical protein
VSIPRDFGYSILANTFLGNHRDPETYPEFAADPYAWGSVTWLGLMQCRQEPVATERIKCQFAYFQTAANIPHLAGTITFRRSHANFLTEISTCENPIPRPSIHIGAMENRGNVIVDFAHKKLHINAIIPSATQEEVLFSVRPECFLGMLICEQMDCDDAIVIVGARHFVKYKGYLDTFAFDGVVDAPFAEECGDVVLAIDSSVGESFNPVTGARDINKAAVGFAMCRDLLGEAVVSTGGWGTGAFGHDHKIKFLQQLVAAAAVGVKLEYAAYFRKQHEEWYNELADGVLRAAPRVCDLWAVLQGAGNRGSEFLEALAKAGIFGQK